MAAKCLSIAFRLVRCLSCVAWAALAVAIELSLIADGLALALALAFVLTPRMVLAAATMSWKEPPSVSLPST